MRHWRVWLLAGVAAVCLAAVVVQKCASPDRQIPSAHVGMTMPEAHEALGEPVFGICDGGSGTMIYREGIAWRGYRETAVDYERDDDFQFRAVAVRTSNRRPDWLDTILKPIGR